MKHILIYEQWLAKQGQPFLFEGGAYGHMAHVYEDKDLTFGQMFEITFLPCLYRFVVYYA